MKTTKLAIALAALATSAGFALAQNEDVIRERLPVPPSPPDALVEAQVEQELQLAASKDQLKQAERSLNSSRNTMRLAQAKAGEAKGLTRTMSSGGWRSGSGANRTLVIPKDAGDAKNLTEVEEDLNVMAHILDKAATGDSKASRAMGITVFGRTPGFGGSSPNLYIEGYGAVFFVNVNYPLLPAPDKEADTEVKEKKPSEWDEAKREMTGPAAGGADTFFSFSEGFDRQFVWEGGSAAAYDAAKVEDLKGDIIAALKNASHIRKLKPDEVVTVVVTGASAGGGGRTIKGSGNKPGLPKEEPLVIEMKAGERAPAPGKLVLRTRKSDAEAFQSGKLNLDEFKKKVTVVTY